MAVLSPERQRLAAAQAKLAEWEAWLSHAQAAGFKKVDDACNECGQSLQAAEATLRQAQEAAKQPRAALSRALGLSTAPPTIAEAERAVSVAREAFDAAWRERDLVRQEVSRLSGQGGEVDRARYRVQECVAEILRAEGIIDRLLAERMQLLSRANAVRNALKVISFAIPDRQGMIWQSYPHLEMFPPDNSVSAPLAAAVEALKSNSAAVLPDLPPEPAPLRADEAA